MRSGGAEILPKMILQFEGTLKNYFEISLITQKIKRVEMSAVAVIGCEISRMMNIS